MFDVDCFCLVVNLISVFMSLEFVMFCLSWLVGFMVCYCFFEVFKFVKFVWWGIEVFFFLLILFFRIFF